MTVSYIYKGTGHEIDLEAAWDYIRDGYLLPPRTILKGWTKLSPHSSVGVPLDQKDVAPIFERMFRKELGDIAGSRRSVMFSGGFDSLLVACLIQRYGAQVTAVTIQFDGFNPRTVEGSIYWANRMGLRHRVLYINIAEFLFAFGVLAGMTCEPVVDLDLAVVCAALRKYKNSIAGSTFVSGMGSDQWFGNMAFGNCLGGAEARLDWTMVDEDAHHRVAQAYGCKFNFPFLSEDALTLSYQVPPDMKKNKKMLRALAVANMIPLRGTRSEVQVPSLIRYILVKTYGDRAWPEPIMDQGKRHNVDDKVLRQIVLGLWLEKNKAR